jgi:hypothetical protein
MEGVPPNAWSCLDALARGIRGKRPLKTSKEAILGYLEAFPEEIEKLKEEKAVGAVV